MNTATLDFDACYAVDGYDGVAFNLLGYDVGAVDDSGYVDYDESRVRAVMIGDQQLREAIDIGRAVAKASASGQDGALPANEL